MGLHNDEAIESGAFWFYRKLGFRPVLPEVARLSETEEARMARTPGYRTPTRTLRKLAQGSLIFNGGPEWDRFSVRHLCMRLAEKSESLALPEQIVRAKRAPTETRYLRLLQRDPKLRSAVLRLGSS